MKKSKNSTMKMHQLQDALIVDYYSLLLGEFKGNAKSEDCMKQMVEDSIYLIKADVEPWYVALNLEIRFPKCSANQYNEAFMLAIQKFRSGEEELGTESNRKDLLSVITSIGPGKCFEAGILDMFYGTAEDNKI